LSARLFALGLTPFVVCGESLEIGDVLKVLAPN